MRFILYGIQVTLLAGGLLWKTVQLTKRPSDIPLWVVVATLTAAISGWVINTVHGRASAPATSDDTILLWIGHTLNPVVVCYGIACFYVVASQPVRRRLRDGLLWRSGLLLIAIAIGGTATVSGPTSAASSHVIFLVSNLYCGAVLAATAAVCHQYARSAEPRLQLGLLIVSTGAGVIALGCAVKAFVIVATWRGGHLERLSTMVGTVMLAGVVLFLVGILYPAVRMRATAIRMWVRHFSAYRHLRPLWIALSTAFPEDTLRIPDETLWEKTKPSSVHRRLHRRIIEIRDGLVHISPYLGANSPSAPEDLAPALRSALARLARGEHATTTDSYPVAIPAQAGRRSELETLVALSNAFAHDRQVAAS
ncbi:MAB_1171c family putative transporter [Amycolatopsis japonica]|uniref:MAB_1171c family putative transporter n=1 Tax=Amycolatopsis japonica TaxID=208439 RepID=UPI00378A3558